VTVSLKNTFLFASEQVAEIISCAGNLVCDVYNTPSELILTALEAIDLTSVGPECLTASHAIFLQLCIAARMYELATNYLSSNQILEINPTTSYLITEDYLKFFYYGGVCFAVLKMYKSALEFFTTAITIPSEVPSQISIASFKKADLISLVHCGKAYEMPSYTSSPMMRYARDIEANKPYHALRTAFQSDDSNLLRKAIVLHAKDLESDGNLGLGRDLLPAHTVKTIKNLTAVYLTLSLTDIASMASLSSDEAAESLLVRLIVNGEIEAVIDKQTNMVRFGARASAPDDSSNGKDLEEHNTLSLLIESTKETMALSAKVRDLKKTVLTSPQALKAVRSAASSGKKVISSDYYADGQEIDV
jgi:COP9 signalosome complex subunit 3